MADSVRRGWSANDAREFGGAGLAKLETAMTDMAFLLNRGYAPKTTSTFIGNHYQLSERQRIALCRAAASETALKTRCGKEKGMEGTAGQTVHIDGFNAVILLETALSGSLLLRCMDGSLRDLAGLRGTYRIIDKTEEAVRRLLRELAEHRVGRAVFWLDEPVSNSGRLRELILRECKDEGVEIQVHVAPNVDRTLYALENVVSVDSVVLDNCPSWTNLYRHAIEKIDGAWIVDLSRPRVASCQ